MNASIVTSVIQIGTPSDKRASMYTLLALIPLRRGSDQSESVGLLADHLSGVLGARSGRRGDDARQRRLFASPMSRHFDPSTTPRTRFAVNEMASQRGAHRSRCTPSTGPNRSRRRVIVQRRLGHWCPGHDLWTLRHEISCDGRLRPTRRNVPYCKQCGSLVQGRDRRTSSVRASDERERRGRWTHAGAYRPS